MSRSYRKHFWFPTEGDKDNKKFYSRKMRHQHNIPFGNSYKKINQSRNIHCWYIHYMSEDDFISQNIGYDTEENLKKIWRIHFRAK